ncbi:biotin--[acetyl-CoA-carboxylase] ligase [Enterococcus sp. JM4C]|uniref:biotin--[acetyl-CoA-carboxylase] ligase n=1 Tax=Candidatus Enterococcus huntleyi TaxID=1857217 RepID=UPI00137B3CCA|nr:biotin--[acetyl-CoA-carboxylase] ligase [Enterococcus sp. JM4C]KAF1297963.1 biotin--[acetyl-CoA-carboxylase] ligase [Enterococcus sp. JM4C]
MSTKMRVLALLKNTSAALSGEKIAQELGVSRTAIWKAIKELEKSGYQFEHQAIGYRYLPSDVLSKEDITQQLPEMAVEVSPTSDSTMKVAKHAAIDGQIGPKLFVADMQEQPKGRFGRPFYAEKGRGIYMSLLLSPNRSFEELPQYTVLAAVAVSEAIDSLVGVTTEIKWVNDIYLNGKKICGILSEAISDMESGNIAHIIIGIGLNFSLPQENFPAELQEKASSLFPNGQATLTRNELITKIWQRFFYHLDHLDTSDYLAIYREKSFVLGKTVTFVQKNQTHTGIATSITELGELVVQVGSEPFVLSSGEISLKEIK